MRRFRSILLCLVLAWPLAASASRFVDVPDDHRYLDAINYAWQHGIIAGYPDGTFRPGNLVNRAEFVKLVTLYLYGPGSQELTDCTSDWPYADAPADAWYARYLCRATADGMVNGYDDGTFRGDSPVNFAEAAKVISIVDVAAGKAQALPPQDGEGPWYKRYIDHLSIRHAIPLEIRSVDEYVTRGELVDMFFLLDTTPDDVATRPSGDLGKLSWRTVLDECVQEPTLTTDGVKQYPKRAQFKHLGYLGEVLTAQECTVQRLTEVAGAPLTGRSGQYPSLKLTEQATPTLRRLLEQGGFNCQSKADPDMCLDWGSTSTVAIQTLLDLREYAPVIASFSCPTCARNR